MSVSSAKPGGTSSGPPQPASLLCNKRRLLRVSCSSSSGKASQQAASGGVASSVSQKSSSSSSGGGGGVTRGVLPSCLPVIQSQQLPAATGAWAGGGTSAPGCGSPDARPVHDPGRQRPVSIICGVPCQVSQADMCTAGAGRGRPADGMLVCFMAFEYCSSL